MGADPSGHAIHSPAVVISFPLHATQDTPVESGMCPSGHESGQITPSNVGKVLIVVSHTSLWRRDAGEIQINYIL